MTSFINFLKYIILFTFIIVVFSCGTSNQTIIEKPVPKYNNPNLILFLVLRISNDSINNKNIIEVVSHSKSSGKFKPNTDSNPEYENDLSFELFDQGKLISSTIIEHPLFKTVEFTDELNNLTKKIVKLNKKEFFVRLQMTNDSDNVRIFEKLKNGSKTELNNVKL